MAFSCHILLPRVCDALAKSRNEFSQAPQSHKVVLHRLPLKQEPKLNLLYYTVTFALYIVLQQLHKQINKQM